MTTRCLLGALACLGALAIFPLSAQTAAGKKADPTGLGVLQKDRPKGAKTEITSQTEATFDNTSSIATFVGKVVVKDPQFNLFCDKLTVYLRADRKGIERAEAEGKVVIVQENKNDKGEDVKSVGRAGKAVFVPDSGDVTLTIWPQLQQGINNQVATDQNTVMILNRAGRLKTIGGSRVTLVDADKGLE